MQSIRLPPVSYFLLEAAGVKDGAKQPGEEVVGTVSLKHIYEIARVCSTVSCAVHVLICWCVLGMCCMLALNVRKHLVSICKILPHSIAIIVSRDNNVSAVRMRTCVCLLL
jgi:hypothetical protein